MSLATVNKLRPGRSHSHDVKHVRGKYFVSRLHIRVNTFHVHSYVSATTTIRPVPIAESTRINEKQDETIRKKTRILFKEHVCV